MSLAHKLTCVLCVCLSVQFSFTVEVTQVGSAPHFQISDCIVLKTRYSYISCSKCGNARLPAGAGTTSTSQPSPAAAAARPRCCSHSAATAATAAGAVAAEEADAAADIDAGQSICPVHVQAVYRLRSTATGYDLEKVRVMIWHNALGIRNC